MDTPVQVLVLEDSPADAELMVRALQSAGMSVDWLRVDTAESFSAALAARDWDIILADFSVPGFGATGGLELLQKLGHDIPFLVVSGSIGEEAAVTLLRSGADNFLLKNHLGRLGPAVERAIREAQQRSAKRRAEEEIRLLARRWRLLLDHVRAGVALHETIRDDQGQMIDFRYLEWNRAAEQIMGLAREKVLGRTGRELFPDVVRSGLLARYARVMDTGASELIEEYPVGGSRPGQVLDVSCFRLDSQHFVSLFRDVTERKLAERRLREYAAEVALGNHKLERVNAELERRNRELEEFAHVASHDLQEPLRKVVSFGDLLARTLGDKLDARCGQYLFMMQDASRRLQTLIRDLLVMSRTDRNPLRMELKPLEECVRAALDLLSARIQETGARVRIDPLPTLTVDPSQICRLYQNLISNALKFSRKGIPPEIRFTCEQGPSGPILGVADNGIGIEPEYHDKVFEAFQRLHSQEKYEGSGIGLAVCRKIVRRHGGRIWVESRLGEGSHFRFLLTTSAEGNTPGARSEAGRIPERVGV